MTPEREKEIRDLIEQARELFNPHDVRGLAPELDLANGAAELFDEVEQLQAEIKKADEAGFQVSGALEWHRMALAKAREGLVFIRDMIKMGESKRNRFAAGYNDGLDTSPATPSRRSAMSKLQEIEARDAACASSNTPPNATDDRRYLLGLHNDVRRFLKTILDENTGIVNTIEVRALLARLEE